MSSNIEYLEERMVIDSISGCWNWTRSLDSRRYGSAWLNGKKILAHRMSYICFNGDIPNGMCVCHKCDNGKCINPNHLFLGTQRDNMIDASIKGRFNGRTQSFKKGEFHKMAKLSEYDVLAIRRNLRLGMKQKYIANLYKVDQTTISGIKRKKLWTHI